MAALDTFVEQLRAELQTALGIELVPGMLNARQKRELGSVWASGKTKVDDMAVDEVIEARVRVYQPFDESFRRNAEKPVDPDRLYELADAIQTAIRSRRATLGPWILSWQSTEIDLEDQGLEVVLTARQANLAETYAA